ncbi:3-oxoacyl-[acyl-carrier-protein] synthase III C-terminal domain-containing protein [Antrihabitans sp. YC2-6]|uniref:3-oxoacyl-[acyl-carrier-protein] synthase III C-terminal domain-containing protein n=1 Tax=Antrihabitans sp. YC2-6 TaxID=2799498 RepID=UPI0018F4A142|nr:3-oxoacyl-[acyl-carrier-protein] synthase III C-terminal domain-containing protein [Antrihabitans sp. YC2-6]MBJ8347023.1 3-oxoacyl-ACP synthase [Antrihabitans sp. YC2-6]
MGTIIDNISVTHGGWRTKHSALHLGVNAAKECLSSARCDPNDLDLVVNAGLYRDRNLGEPALAALIQEDIGANPEDPHAGGHGTFSFDVANGACGAVTATQIIDGFLRTGTVGRGLVVTSDADPGHGMSKDFPFAPTGAALLCSWTDADCGFGEFHWVRADDESAFSSTVRLDHRQNVLHFDISDTYAERFAAVAARAAEKCLATAELDIDDLDMIVAAPSDRKFCIVLGSELGMSPQRITAAATANSHTAAILEAMKEAVAQLRPGGTALVLAAGAGIEAVAVLYRKPEYA